MFLVLGKRELMQCVLLHCNIESMSPMSLINRYLYILHSRTLSWFFYTAVSHTTYYISDKVNAWNTSTSKSILCWASQPFYIYKLTSLNQLILWFSVTSNSYPQHSHGTGHISSYPFEVVREGWSRDTLGYNPTTWDEGNFTWRAPLAGCSWEDWVQGWCDGVPVSARTGTSLPHRQPHPSLRCCNPSSSSTISQPELSHCTVPRCRLSTYGCRAFDYAGPTVWNSLPDEFRNSDSFDNFKRFMKTILFSRYYCVQRIRGYFITRCAI